MGGQAKCNEIIHVPTFSLLSYYWRPRGWGVGAPEATDWHLVECIAEYPSKMTWGNQ